MDKDQDGNQHDGDKGGHEYRVQEREHEKRGYELQEIQAIVVKVEENQKNESPQFFVGGESLEPQHDDHEDKVDHGDEQACEEEDVPPDELVNRVFCGDEGEACRNAVRKEVVVPQCVRIQEPGHDHVGTEVDLRPEHEQACAVNFPLRARQNSAVRVHSVDQHPAFVAHEGIFSVQRDVHQQVGFDESCLQARRGATWQEK